MNNSIIENKKLSILLIGGAGYIGSHVLLDLNNNGYKDVTVFDNLSTGYIDNIADRANFILGNILNPQDLQKAFTKSFDIVFHFAALKSAGESMISPSKFAIANISGTINILNAMEKNNIKNIVFSSSAAVYGTPKYLPIDEKHFLDPINFYGYTKLEIERLLAWYNKLKGIKFAVLRYFNAAGYDINQNIFNIEKNSSNLLPIIMETAIGERKLLKVFGSDYDTKDGTCIRDYIHVNDLSDAHIKSMNYIINTRSNLVLNLSSGRGFSVLEVIKMSKMITGKKIDYKIVDRREGDVPRLFAKSKLAKEKINWESRYSSLEKILETMWNSYKKKK